mgnify:CR=1 FL=1
MSDIYSVSFSAVAASAAQDLFEVVSAAAGVVKILGFELFQTSDHGDAAAEGLQLLWVRGHSTSGSGGSSFTPVLRSTKQGAATSTCEINNTTVATSGTGVNVYAGGWNAQAGITYWWTPETQPILRNSERGVLRMSAPADAITLNGVLYIEET